MRKKKKKKELDLANILRKQEVLNQHPSINKLKSYQVEAIKSVYSFLTLT